MVTTTSRVPPCTHLCMYIFKTANALQRANASSIEMLLIRNHMRGWRTLGYSNRSSTDIYNTVDVQDTKLRNVLRMSSKQPPSAQYRLETVDSKSINKEEIDLKKAVEESNSPIWNEHFGSKTSSRSLALYCLNSFVTVVIGVSLSKAGLANYMGSHDTKLSKTRFPKVFQQQPTKNSYQFYNNVWGSSVNLRSHMRVNGSNFNGKDI